MDPTTAVQINYKNEMVFLYLFLFVFAALVATRLKRLSNDGCGGMGIRGKKQERMVFYEVTVIRL